MGGDSQDSKELWHRIHAELPEINIKLGPAAAAAYAADPKMLLFMASRYKFVAKMLEGTQSVVEIGCGDAFGAPIVAQSVGRLLCTDIHEASLADNARRLGFAAKLEFRYFDFRVQRLDPAFDAAYAVDVLEHVYPAEEEAFLGNIARSLAPHGVALFGTPNSYSEQFASKYSKLGHVNLKDAQALRATMQRYFHVVFMFSMNDEVVHTGFAPMAHYLWALCVAPRAG